MATKSNRLFVGSLPWETTSEQLRSLFERVGEVIDAVVIKDKKTDRSKGYGFVEMKTAALAQMAAQKFNGYELSSRSLVVNVAEPKAPKTLFMG